MRGRIDTGSLKTASQCRPAGIGMGQNEDRLLGSWSRKAFAMSCVFPHPAGATTSPRSMSKRFNSPLVILHPVEDSFNLFDELIRCIPKVGPTISRLTVSIAVTVLYQPAPLFAAAAKISLPSSVIPLPRSSALMAARFFAFPEADLMFSLMKDSSLSFMACSSRLPRRRWTGLETTHLPAPCSALRPREYRSAAIAERRFCKRRDCRVAVPQNSGPVAEGSKSIGPLEGVVASTVDKADTQCCKSCVAPCNSMLVQPAQKSDFTCTLANHY